MRRLLASKLSFPPKFANRNPRNLELLNLAQKDKGNHLSRFGNTHYYKVTFDSTSQDVSAKIIHSSGNVVFHLSSKDPAVNKFIIKGDNINNAKKLAKLFAFSCLQSGIFALKHYRNNPELGEKENSFLEIIERYGIELEEVENIERRYIPGYDYDEKL
ncbi:MAG: ribosomal protein L18 [Marteilia pararefringens]